MPVPPFWHTEEYAGSGSLQRSGLGRVQIHPPAIAAWDIKICEAVRKAVGDDYRIMLDSTWSYDYPDALTAGRAAEGDGLLLV